jgi:integrase
MPQIRIPRGSHGEITTKQQSDGRWAARAQVRDIDGRIRSVRVKDGTKGGALRAIRQRLQMRVDPTIKGITPETTYDTLAALWLQHRQDHGKVRTKGKLAPQTLATYNAEIEHVIIPAIGKVRVGETNVPFLDRLFADVEHGRKHGNYQPRRHGRSTRQLRVVLGGMISLAVAHGALAANPMRDASQSAREPKTEVDYLTVPHALHLRSRVRREAMRVDGRRMPNRDLEEFVDLLLGTGMREGEGLAIRPIDLTELPTDPDHPSAERCADTGEAIGETRPEGIEETLPVLHVCGTLVEPRKGYVDKLHRQDMTKAREDRRLVLPDHVARMLVERMRRQPPATPESPIFGTRTGNWISPANMRTRLRLAIDRTVENGEPADKELDGTTLHTLRRTVGTLIAHEVSLDAARDQLGHRDPSITYRHYVGKRPLAPDLRSTLNQFFEPVDEPVDHGGEP